MNESMTTDFISLLLLTLLVSLFSGCGSNEPPTTAPRETIDTSAHFSEEGLPGLATRGDLPETVILDSTTQTLDLTSNATTTPGSLTVRSLDEIITPTGETVPDSTPGIPPTTSDVTVATTDAWTPDAIGRDDFIWEDSIPPECNKDYTWYAATHSVTYTNADLGFEFDFRTQPGWGDESNSSNPYEVIPHSSDFRLRFGPLATFKGCDLPQYFLLDIGPARSSDAILADLTRQTWSDPPPTALSINGNDVVLYESAGLCEHPQIEIVGPRYNLLFYPICGDTEEADVLLKLAEGVRWL